MARELVELSNCAETGLSSDLIISCVALGRARPKRRNDDGDLLLRATSITSHQMACAYARARRVCGNARPARAAARPGLISGVTTIVKLANDIDGAVKAASRSKKSCEKLAERVADIGDLLKGVDTSSPSTAAVATRRLVGRLERALRRALLLVTSCQSTSRIYSLVAGGWQAEQFDKVNAEIDRCLLDLSLSSLALVSTIDHKLNAAAAAAGGETNTEVAPPLPPVLCSHGHDQDDGEDKMAAGGAAEKNGELICYGGEQDGKTETDAGEVVTTIGVPAATAAYMHYQLSPPPPPPCYGCHLHYCHCTHGHCHCAGGRHYSPSYYSDDSADLRLRHMFSDENPNACSIM
uniref:MCAfunc domain-containing protein n=1 Tax=Oryza glaberrima TaxID=4538 RepID=A0A679BB09_ORYGL|nr:hypothetical protein [Oryza glaberrima]